jgi:Flp pilus assembly pilin Flp
MMRITRRSSGRKIALTNNILWTVLARIGCDRRGQDLIEYALMAGFVAVAAGAFMPGVAGSISTIFSDIASVMAVAASQS